MMRCDYCESSFNVEKFKYKGKTSDGKRRQITLKFCLDCQCHGVASSQEKVGWLWSSIDSDTIKSADGDEMTYY
jgi:hypothetical protein